MFKPNLKDYDFDTLIALFYKSTGEYSRDEIKNVIIKKMVAINYPLFYFIHKFKSSKAILKELYADLILVKSQDEMVHVDTETMNEILKFASLDALIYYGANSCSPEISKKCQEEFYNRSEEIEDKTELNRKSQKGPAKRMILRVINT